MPPNRTPALLQPSQPREPWKIRKTHAQTTSSSRAWVSDDDEKLIQLRSQGWSWMAISKALPGKTQSCCRLRYREFLNQSSQWTEERKNSLSREYARYESAAKTSEYSTEPLLRRSREQVWSMIGGKSGIPWRAAEAMHWHLGEHEIVQRAIITSRTTPVPEKKGEARTQQTAADDPPPGKRPAQDNQRITLPPISAILPEFYQHGWMAGRSSMVPRIAYQERWQGKPQ